MTIGPRDSPPVLVVHGVGKRDESDFVSQVADLQTSLGIRSELVPVYWGGLLRPDDRIDSIPPYSDWAESEFSSSPTLGAALRSRDLEALFDEITDGWHRLSDHSRHKLLGTIYNRVHDSYVAASAHLTGDLVYYQQHGHEIRQQVWDVLDQLDTSLGQPDHPVSIIAHSLGSTIVFDMALDEECPLHIDRLFSCATQSPFFHVIGCSPSSLDPGSTGVPTTLPKTIRSWTNYFVGLDPWAYLTSPVFTLSDGSSPNDVEVRSGGPDDRIGIHTAEHYWSHPLVIKGIRNSLSRLD